MQETQSFAEFVAANHKELCHMVSYICRRNDVQAIDDVIQDVYLHLFNRQVIEGFDPTRRYKAKISTYLFPILENLVLSHRKSRHFRFEKSRMITPEDSVDGDDIEFALRYNDFAQEYSNIVSEDMLREESLDLRMELESFGRYLERKNQHYELRKRRNPRASSSGCTLHEVFEMFRDGLNNHEIALHYGVSDTFVSNLKKLLRQEMSKYGITWKPRSKRRRRKKA